MRVGLAQINSHLGNFSDNRKKILEYTDKANQRHCSLVVFPELSLFGYIPGDLLERESIVDQQLKELNKLHKKLPQGIAILLGAITKNPKKNGKDYLNSAVLLERGKKMKVFSKELLPSYDVFDETRHIQSGDLSKNIFKFKGKKILVSICEDIWGWERSAQKASLYKSNPVKKIKSSEVDLVVNLSASPFTKVKKKLRTKVAKKTINHLKAPMVYVNLVGAQDEIVFDGGSFAMDKNNKIISECARFEEDINVVDFDESTGGERKQSINNIEALRQALSLGIREFVEKIGLNHVHFGLSGGIDSALVACLAVDALGPGRVSCFALPGPYSSDLSFKLASELAENLGVEFKSIDINSSYEASLQSFGKSIGDLKFGTVHENMQARLRALFLMAYSNHKGSLLLNTSNKSEICVGYSTLYGDMCGGLAPIGDLLKREVYELCDYYNSEAELIPQGILKRAPSAELRPDQKDEDTLPSYDELDKSVEKLINKMGKATTPVDKRVLKMMMASEFKRWQSPPVLKVSQHAFGRGRRFPIAHKAVF